MLSEIITDGKAKASYAEARKGEQKRSVCTPEKAGKFLSWKPKTDFEEGLERTVEYFKKAHA